MKFLKKLLAITYCFLAQLNTLLAQSVPVGQLRLPPGTSSISFEWQGDSIHSKWEPYAAMVIPVKLKGCPRTFYMQFDLGAPASLLYTNKLNAIRQKYPDSVLPADSTGNLAQWSFSAGRVPIIAENIVVKQFNGTAVNWEEKIQIEIIGTIGTDLIDGKVLVLDYPGKKIHILPVITEKLKQQVALYTFTYVNKSVLLPAMLNGKNTLLFFDTGSSMFELLTNRETCLQLAVPDAKAVRYEVNSWGRVLLANTYTSSASIHIANTKLPLQSVTYMEGASNAQVDRMLKAGIGGMTGNKLFLQKFLILDTKSRQFGLLPMLKKSDFK